MTDFGLSEKDLLEITRVLSQYAEVEEALVFGSRAMGHFKPNSDVDIALKGNVSFDILSKISYQLNEELSLPYTFDVIAYSSIDNPDLKDHVDHYGKYLYSSK